MKFRDILKSKEFIVTTELDPPKGVDITEVEKKIRVLEPYVDGINFTDSPMARMKMTPIAISHYLKDKFAVDFICHMTGRDRSLIGLQSELLGGALLGVDNYLFLTGDKPDVGDHPMSTGIFDCDGTELIKLAKQLNQGLDFAGNELTRAPAITIGAGINPGGDLEVEIPKLQERCKVGARFFQTQPVYDPELVYNFMTEIKKIPEYKIKQPRFLIGVMPLRSGKMAQYLHNHVPGINIPDKVLKYMENGDLKDGLYLAREFVEEIKDIVDGIHIMPMGKAEVVIKLLQGINNYKEKRAIF